VKNKIRVIEGRMIRDLTFASKREANEYVESHGSRVVTKVRLPDGMLSVTLAPESRSK
jgi:hypothetical protein